MNVGFVEALNTDPTFDCFILHDVDMLPEHERNDYSCPPQGKARHLSWLIDIWDYKFVPYHLRKAHVYTVLLFIRPMYKGYAGGVTAISTKDFVRLNGFSNQFWGWGAEDDDFYRRMVTQNIDLTRKGENDPLAAEYAKYRTLYHKQAKITDERIRTFNKTKGVDNIVWDGINSLKYRKEHVQLKPYYVHVVVQLQSDGDATN